MAAGDGVQKLQEVVSELEAREVRNKIVVLCMKGIEIETGRRLSQVASDTLDHSNHIAVWLGPGHVQEFYRGIPNCMVIDSNDELVKDDLIRNFSSELIRFYYGTDLIGNEIGAAAKNVIGIAAGMLEGLDLSSLKGALMARGTGEIARLIAAMGGNAGTVYGLAEGYYTVKAIRKLGKAYGVELPICEAVYQIAHEGKEPKSILKSLFERSLKNEFV